MSEGKLLVLTFLLMFGVLILGSVLAVLWDWNRAQDEIERRRRR